MKRVIITILMIYFSLVPVDGVKADVPVEINDLNRLISESAGNLTINSSPIVVVDHFSDFDAIADNADGVHPNRLGDKKMAKVWKNSLLQYDLDYSKNYSIMPLGDSITHLNYRYDLWLELKQSNLSFDFIGSQSNFPWAFDINSDNFEFDLDHEGHSGWRSDQISYNLENWVKLNNPDIVYSIFKRTFYICLAKQPLSRIFYPDRVRMKYLDLLQKG